MPPSDDWHPVARILLGTAIVGGVAYLVYANRDRILGVAREVGIPPSVIPGGFSSSSSMGTRMQQAIVSKARELVTPDPSLHRDYVGEPEKRWVDTVLGGETGPGAWRWFTKGKGTTCMVFMTAVLEQAGVPKEYLNRPWPGEDTSGKPTEHYHFGAWMAPMQKAGSALGAPLVYENNPSTLTPGDVYVVTRDATASSDPAIDRTHVGIVLETTDQVDEGLALTTADGGQTDPEGRQCARIMHRTLKGNRMQGPFGGATLIARLHPSDDAENIA